MWQSDAGPPRPGCAGCPARGSVGWNKQTLSAPAGGEEWRALRLKAVLQDGLLGNHNSLDRQPRLVPQAGPPHKQPARCGT